MQLVMMALAIGAGVGFGMLILWILLSIVLKRKLPLLPFLIVGYIADFVISYYVPIGK